MSFISKLVNKIPGLPKPRSGQLTRTKFRSRSLDSPIQDAVELRNSFSEGDKLITSETKSFVRLRNGSSLSSDGESIVVHGQNGQEVQQFNGSISVTPDEVLLKDFDEGVAQSFGHSSNSVHQDKNLLVLLGNGGKATALVPTDNGFKMGSSGKMDSGVVQLDSGEKAYPILNPEWLLTQS